MAASIADAVPALLALAAGAPDDFRPLRASSYIFLTAVGVVAVITYRKVMPLS